jgi:hypothetical protein
VPAQQQLAVEGGTVQCYWTEGTAIHDATVGRSGQLGSGRMWQSPA